MNNVTIHEPSKEFDFSGLELALPVTMSSGFYMTRFQYHKAPMYFQTPRGTTRNGFVKTNTHKWITDLLFDSGTNETFLAWIELLESTAQQLLLAKSSEWFQDHLTIEDIDVAFSPCLKLFHSGKSCALRVKVKTGGGGTKAIPSVKIYDEEETVYGIDSIQPHTSLISVVELQGILFTSQSFTLEFELKQMMISATESANGEDGIFDRCIFKPVSTSTKTEEGKVSEVMAVQPETEPMPEPIPEPELAPAPSPEPSASPEPPHEQEKEDIIVDDCECLEEVDLMTLGSVKASSAQPSEVKEKDKEKEKENEEEKDKEKEKENEEEKDKEKEKEEEQDAQQEQQVQDEKEPPGREEDKTSPVEEPVEPVLKLKRPEDVYLELYNLARVKAKKAKKDALLAFLDAEKIKHTYLQKKTPSPDLTTDASTPQDPDSDLDSDIEEFSLAEWA